MKFVPCVENRMSDSNKTKIGRWLILHTTKKGNAKVLRMTIKDPAMKLECRKGKTLGEAILVSPLDIYTTIWCSLDHMV